MNPRATPLPRLPVLGWSALAGRRAPPTDCMLDIPGMHFTTSGRAAILLALEMLGVGPGDRVLLPTYHCPTMVSPASARQATPAFYPIDEHGSPLLEWLDAQDLRGVKAILVAHFFGLPQPMRAMRRWCDAHGIALVEDCAHALFGRSGERPVGTWGDVAIASLTKFLPVPEGGCLVANNHAAMPALAPCPPSQQAKAVLDIVEEGARHGRLAGLNSLVSGALAGLRKLRPHPSGGAPLHATGAPDDAAHAEAADGFSINVPLAHRALAWPCKWVARALPLSRIVLRRQARYAELARRLAGRPGLRPLLPVLPADSAPYVFPLWVDRPDPGYAELRRLQMPVFRWDRLWPGMPELPGDHGARWSHHVLQLACHQDLSDAELDELVETVLRLYTEPAPQPARTTES